MGTKNRLFYIMIAVILLFMTACDFYSQYPTGKDTVESFCKGKFQIVGRNPSGLYFKGEGSPLISCVDCTYETNNRIYILGHERHKDHILIYGVIDAKQNKIQILFTDEVYLSDRFLESDSISFCNDFSDFLEEDQKIFTAMEAGKIGDRSLQSESDS